MTFRTNDCVQYVNSKILFLLLVEENFQNSVQILANELKRYSRLSLSRTRKGPTNLFEIEKVRNRENYRKNLNFY